MWEVDDAQIDEAARQMTMGAPRGDLGQRVIREIVEVGLNADPMYGWRTYGIAEHARWIVPIAAAAAIALVVRFAPQHTVPETASPERTVSRLETPPRLSPPELEVPATSARPSQGRDARPQLTQRKFIDTGGGEMSMVIEPLEIAALEPPAPIMIDELQISSIAIDPLPESIQQQD